MELTSSNVFMAMWVTTWILAQYRIWYPSMAVLQRMEPHNNTIRWWPAAWLIFGAGSFITAPIMIFPVLSDRYRDNFVRVYVQQLLQEQE